MSFVFLKFSEIDLNLLFLRALELLLGGFFYSPHPVLSEMVIFNWRRVFLLRECLVSDVAQANKTTVTSYGKKLGP
jgi:hypothetical protein